MDSTVPSTPPRQLAAPGALSMYTPATPRFAPIDEPDARIYRPKGLSQDPVLSKQATRASLDVPPLHAAPIVPLTPADTPVNRKRHQETVDILANARTPGNSLSRNLFPSHSPVAGRGRTPRRHARTTSVVNSVSTAPKLFHVLSDQETLHREINDYSVTSHPHQAHAPNVPGMWYVFRGKKVFRPFPRDKDPAELDIKPRRLFTDSTSATLPSRPSHPSRGPSSIFDADANSEEDETDVEDNEVRPPAASFSDRIKFFYR